MSEAASLGSLSLAPSLVSLDFSSGGVGGLGGEKKLKKESVGTDFLMVRVCFVSAVGSAHWIACKTLPSF